MSYFAYILKSEYDGTFYYGSTKNLQERLKIQPWEIYYFEEYLTRSEAAQREKFFKSIDGYNFLGYYI